VREKMRGEKRESGMGKSDTCHCVRGEKRESGMGNSDTCHCV